MLIQNQLLSGAMGLSAATLGKMFRNITDDQAVATVEAARQLGARYSTRRRCTAHAYPKSDSAGNR